jgi:hypothetical protein
MRIWDGYAMLTHGAEFVSAGVVLFTSSNTAVAVAASGGPVGWLLIAEFAPPVYAGSAFLMGSGVLAMKQGIADLVEGGCK